MRSYFLYLLIPFLLSPVLQAQTENAPHNGQLKRAGYFNVEVVDCSGYLEIYLYELNMYPVRNNGLSGTVDLHYPDSTCVTVPLYRYGIDGFTAEPERPLYKSCELFIRGQGVSIQVTFSDLVCNRPEE